MIRAVVLAALIALAPADPARAQADGAGVALRENWQTFRDPRTGIGIQIPTSVLTPLAATPAETVRAYAGPDGARLTLIARANDRALDLSRLEQEVRAAQTPDTRILYDARGATWFVIAGRRGTDEFYERFHLSRDGTTISGFVSSYPYAEGPVHDALVARMSRTFTPATRLAAGPAPAAAPPVATTPTRPQPAATSRPKPPAQPPRVLLPPPPPGTTPATQPPRPAPGTPLRIEPRVN
jgi:hypothetical protein